MDRAAGKTDQPLALKPPQGTTFQEKKTVDICSNSFPPRAPTDSNADKRGQADGDGHLGACRAKRGVRV